MKHPLWIICSAIVRIITFFQHNILEGDLISTIKPAMNSPLPVATSLCGLLPQWLSKCLHAFLWPVKHSKYNTSRGLISAKMLVHVLLEDSHQIILLEKLYGRELSNLGQEPQTCKWYTVDHPATSEPPDDRRHRNDSRQDQQKNR